MQAVAVGSRPRRNLMTDKKKKRARVLSEKTGMTHQAAINVIDPPVVLNEDWSLNPEREPAGFETVEELVEIAGLAYETPVPKEFIFAVAEDFRRYDLARLDRQEMNAENLDSLRASLSRVPGLDLDLVRKVVATSVPKIGGLHRDRLATAFSELDADPLEMVPQNSAADSILVVEFEGGPSAKAQKTWIAHGSDIIGRNIVAVLDGDSFHSKDCEWCEHLRLRCRSRRLPD